MSEAADAERDVEDFFNEEIFGAKPEEEKQAPFPTEPPAPEPKPVEQVALEETPEEEKDEEAEAVEGEEAAAVQEGEGLEAEAPEEEVATEEDEVAAWAKKQYGDDIDLENESAKKLARAAWEKEKLLGRKAEEARALQAEADQREIQARIDALNTPGVLTAEEDIWVDEATQAGDPGEYAYDALQAGRPDLYAAVMDRWSAVGETEARRARALHSQVLQLVAQPQPSEQESYTAALGQTFVALGLNIDQHGPLILQKAEELGVTHPAVQGMMSPDENVRLIATRSVYDLVSAGRTTVQKARTDDEVANRVKEEQLREAAAGVTTGGPRVDQPKKSPFWEQFDAEIEERGWDGNRPAYGRDE